MLALDTVTLAPTSYLRLTVVLTTNPGHVTASLDTVHNYYLLGGKKFTWVHLFHTLTDASQQQTNKRSIVANGSLISPSRASLCFNVVAVIMSEF